MLRSLWSLFLDRLDLVNIGSSLCWTVYSAQLEKILVSCTCDCWMGEVALVVLSHVQWRQIKPPQAV